MEQREPSRTAGGNAAADTVEKSTEVPQKLKRQLPYDLAIPLQDKHTEKKENSNSKIRRAPQCSLQHNEQQPRHGNNQVTSTENWLIQVWYIYIYTHNGILLDHKKQRNIAVCNDTDEPKSEVNEVR